MISSKSLFPTLPLIVSHTNGHKNTLIQKNIHVFQWQYMKLFITWVILDLHFVLKVLTLVMSATTGFTFS